MEKNVVDRLLREQAWLLNDARSRIDRIAFSRSPNDVEFEFRLLASSAETSLDSSDGVFFVVRDDLLHPTVGGNKMRKLDAVIPLLKHRGVTDVLTCGGCQSAHATAVAVASAEHGMTTHLLLRGERLAIATGYNLISSIYGNVSYVSRSEYADRDSMFQRHATRIAGTRGTVLWSHSLRQHQVMKPEEDSSHRKIVAVVEEGAGNSLALLGLVRLVDFLRSQPLFGAHEKLRIVVDSGTGTTAIGLAIGAALLGLPWKVIGVMLADTLGNYQRRTELLVSSFVSDFQLAAAESLKQLPLVWCEREQQRRFGNVLKGEMGICKSVARQTGILLDPVYTLAAWETCLQLSSDASSKVVMLHTGGTLGLFGLAQRYPGEF